MGFAGFHTSRYYYPTPLHSYVPQNAFIGPLRYGNRGSSDEEGAIPICDVGLKYPSRLAR
jgi:hypothetical protein